MTSRRDFLATAATTSLLATVPLDLSLPPHAAERPEFPEELNAFTADDAVALKTDAPSVIARYYPGANREFEARGWRLPQSIDRVYVSDAARRSIGYAPCHGFAELLGLAD